MILSRSNCAFLLKITLDKACFLLYNDYVENIVGGASGLRWHNAEPHNLMRIMPP